MSKISKTIGSNIQALRQLVGVSQEFLAHQVGAGMTQSGISKIESGTTDVTLATLERIAQALEVSLTELICFDSKTILFRLLKIRALVESQ